MANQKISQMPSLTASELAAGDLLAVVDVSDVTQASSGSNKKITLTNLQSAAVSAGTANGVLYLNGSKQATSGSALTFDGTSIQVQSNIISGRSGGNDGVFVLKRASDGLTVGTLLINSANSRLELATAYDPITFSNYLGEQMRLTSTGLGIGTSSPARTLDVNGAIRISNGAPIEWGGTDYAIVGDTGGALIFRTAGSERARIDSAGNLGLGVTPRAWVGNAKAVQIGSFTAVWTGSNGSANSGFGAYEGGLNTYNYITTGDAPTMYQQLLGAHKWFTAPSGTAGNPISFTQAMTLDASGNLLVGTSTTEGVGTTVYGAGLLYSRRSESNAATFRRDTSDGSVVIFKRDSTDVGSISITTTATTYNTSSDYRLKNITGPIANSGTYIDSLNPVEGTWKADGSTFVGLIAHEVQEVSRTQVATGEKDGAEMQAMDYSNSELIANLIAEVKSLRVRVAALESN